MRVVLQNTASSLYVSKIGWASSYKEACNFERLDEAIEYSRHNHLSDVQVVIAIERKQGGVEFIPFQIQALIQNASGVEGRAVN